MRFFMSSRTRRLEIARPIVARFSPARASALPLLAMLVGCSILSGSSKVKSGELYETGEARYDAYFKDVHDLQVAAVGWDDERKAACRPLVDVLRLSPDAADVSVVQETHERVKAVARDVGPVKLDISGDEVILSAGNPAKVDEPTRELFKSVELCAHAEVTRGRELHAVPPKVDVLVKSGRELEPHVREDFAKRGGRIPAEVQEEISASYEVLGDVSRRAREGAREAEDFVADLGRAVLSEAPAEETKPDPKAAKGKPAKPAASTPPPPPAAKPPAPPESKPEPKVAPPPPPPATAKPPPPPAAKPKPKSDTGEVFNP